MKWGEELAQMAEEARGDLGVYVALAALRKTENGAPGREFGVLGLPSVDTFEEQCHVAANTIRNHQARYEKAKPGQPVRDVYGFLTADFLRHLSARYAPLGAENDPKGLNANHAGNLVNFAVRFRLDLFRGMMAMGEGGAGGG